MCIYIVPVLLIGSEWFRFCVGRSWLPISSYVSSWRLILCIWLASEPELSGAVSLLCRRSWIPPPPPRLPLLLSSPSLPLLRHLSPRPHLFRVIVTLIHERMNSVAHSPNRHPFSLLRKTHNLCVSINSQTPPHPLIHSHDHSMGMNPDHTYMAYRECQQLFLCAILPPHVYAFPHNSPTIAAPYSHDHSMGMNPNHPYVAAANANNGPGGLVGSKAAASLIPPMVMASKAKEAAANAQARYVVLAILFSLCYSLAHSPRPSCISSHARTLSVSAPHCRNACCARDIQHVRTLSPAPNGDNLLEPMEATILKT